MIQRELAQIIQQEMRDPRLGLVTLNEVRVSRDIAYADVYYTRFGTEPGEDDILNKAAGFLRSELARRLRTRTTPRLRFHYDESLDAGEHMDAAIRTARAGDSDAMGQDDEPSGPPAVDK
jgi:ribosome-binding factor A